MPLRSWSSAVRCFRHAVYLQIQISHPLLNWLAEDSTYARLRLRHWKPQGLCCHVMSWSNHSDVEPGGCGGAAAGRAGSFRVHVRRLKSLNPNGTGFSDAVGISNHSNRFWLVGSSESRRKRNWKISLQREKVWQPGTVTGSDFRIREGGEDPVLTSHMLRVF